MNPEMNAIIEELKERISKNNNEILNLMLKYNQMLSLLLSISSSSEKINNKLDHITERIYTINEASISSLSSLSPLSSGSNTP